MAASSLCPVLHYPSLSSTQDEARSNLQTADTPFVVMADEQTAGRGRSGRKWVSLADNLQCTLAFEAKLPLKHIGQYAFLVAVALQETMAVYGLVEVSLKWPNDILFAGKKIAGILIESEQGRGGQVFLLVGTGVNISSAPDGAAALNAQLDSSIKPRAFLEKFLEVFFLLKAQMESDGFAVIRQKWLQNAHGVGQVIHVRLPAESFDGVFVGLADDGALQVQVTGESHLRIIYSGDVFIGGTS